MGYIARTGDISDTNLKRAMLYGAALGGFAVEKFAIAGFEGVTHPQVHARVQQIRDLMHVDIPEQIA
jgi:hypothetical protein